MGASGSPSIFRNSETRRVTCAGVSMFRLNRINPHGRSERINSRSAALSTVPDRPVMKARLFMRPIRPQVARGSRKPPLIPLDDALPTGRRQAAAELPGLFGGCLLYTSDAADDL